MAVFLGVGYVWLELPSEPMIICAAITAGLIAWAHGYTWDDMVGSISQKMRKTWPALLILLCVGVLIGAWMSSGTIPFLIYWGLKLISPQFLALTALIVTSIVALCTGTSWGSAGTIGVVLMGVALAMDANLAMVAGAVVSGAYFGDKMSPLSDTTNVAAMATRVPLYEHIANLLWTTGPAYVLSIVIFAGAGLTGQASGGASVDQAAAMTSTLASAFSLNPIVLLPVVIVLAGSALRKPTVPVLLLASGVGVFIAVFLQGVSAHSAFTALVSGFDVDMVTRDGFTAEAISDDVGTLLNRGGIDSMMGTLAICFCAIAFAGVMDVTDSLGVVLHAVLDRVKSVFGLVASTAATCLVFIGVTCNGQISVIMPGEALRPAYLERGVHPKVLGRTAEDAATVFEPILPWTAAGAYMAGTLGVATFEYLPWAVLNWSGVMVALLLAATGVGITKISPQQAEKMAASQ